MAETAEAYYREMTSSLEDQPSVEPYRLVDLDVLPELSFTRRRGREQATEILEQNRQLLLAGKPDSVPIPIDALGTARRLAQTASVYGKESKIYKQQRQGLILDCLRLFGETYRKNTWEYFPQSWQDTDPQTGEYYADGHSILEIVASGLSPVAEPEESDRRLNEFVEEKTYQAIGRLGLGETVSVLTISECPDWAIQAHKIDKKSAHGGYVPEIEKLVLRGVRFEGENSNRLEEQLAISGLQITHEVIIKALRLTGGLDEGVELTKTELQGKQFIQSGSSGVIEFIKVLDTLASTTSGKTIFLGEVVSEEHPRDYSTITDEADSRRLELHNKSHQLAEVLIDLEVQGTDRWEAEEKVNSLVKKELLGIASHDPEQAAIIFDETTANGFREVIRLESLGYMEEASRRKIETEREAPEPAFCGAGSCGLEAVSLLSVEAQKAQKLGLKAADKEDLLHDTIRTCPDCKQTKIYYNRKTGDKACIGCSIRQINGKITRKPAKLQVAA